MRINNVAEKQQRFSGRPVALTVAGSDSCGGAGIQADLKAFAAMGVFGASAVTAVTVQNTFEVSDVRIMHEDFVGGQIAACFDDLPIAAVKTGMLANAGITRAVIRELGRARQRADAAGLPLIVDPVMIATSGAALLDRHAIATLRDELLPLATLVTPNLPEAAALAGRPQDTDPETLGSVLLDSGVAAVLIKGGHSRGDRCRDLLMTSNTTRLFDWPRVPGDYHGTGCAFSAAITALCARGLPLDAAVSRAGRWLQQQIRGAFQPRRGNLGMLPFTPEEELEGDSEAATDTPFNRAVDR